MFEQADDEMSGSGFFTKMHIKWFSDGPEDCALFFFPLTPHPQSYNSIETSHPHPSLTTAQTGYCINWISINDPQAHVNLD